MSSGRRAYNLLRAYVNREWDRIRGWERDVARRELEEDDDKEKDSEKKEVAQEQRAVVYVPEGTTQEEAARNILGVAEGAGFAEIRHSFIKLSRRSDSSNFPEGTDEYVQAAEIHKKVLWAYRILTINVSDSEKRFGSLEID
ncbi:MAG TPA: hypothetical protein VNI20_07750 [Fimbriimonadaceae bacterium]|nr:hypothetical protein [Fimbriimonadaceae bacterium]